MLERKGIAWEWLWAGKKGQHHNHQLANCMGYDWVWRVENAWRLPEPGVLEQLAKHIAPDVAGVGGSVVHARP